MGRKEVGGREINMFTFNAAINTSGRESWKKKLISCDAGPFICND